MDTNDSGNPLLNEVLVARYLIEAALHDSGIVTYAEYVEIRDKLLLSADTLHAGLFSQATYFLSRLDISNEKHAFAITALGQVVQTSGKLLTAYIHKKEERDAAKDLP